MKHKVYLVYDKKTEAYSHPMLFQTKGQAIRSFGDACNDPSTQFYKHSQDFSLVEIGDFDDVEGQYIMAETKINVASAWELVKPSDTDSVSRGGKQLELRPN